MVEKMLVGAGAGAGAVWWVSGGFSVLHESHTQTHARAHAHTHTHTHTDTHTHTHTHTHARARITPGAPFLPPPLPTPRTSGLQAATASSFSASKMTRTKKTACLKMSKFPPKWPSSLFSAW